MTQIDAEEPKALSPVSPNPLREPRVIAYAAVRAVSSGGDQLWAVVLAFAAAEVGPPVLVGLVFAAGGAPRVLLMLVGGVMADRVGARKVLIAADLAAAGVCLGVAWAVATSAPEATVIVAAAATFGAVDAFYQPAVGAYLPQLVRATERARVEGMVQAAATTSALAGTAAAGVVFAAGGLSLAARINAVTFLVIAATLVWLRPRYPQHKAAAASSLKSDIGAGVATVRKAPVLRWVTGIALLMNGLALPVVQVGVPLAAVNGGWGAGGFAAVEVCFGVGVVLGGVITAGLPLRRQTIRASWALTMVAAGLLCLVSLNQYLVLAGALLFLTGCVLTPANAILMAAAQADTPPEQFGRVASVLGVVGSAVAPLAALGYGAAAGEVDAGLVGLASAGTLFVILATAGVRGRGSLLALAEDPKADAEQRAR
jgi:MFS family permease